MRKALIVGIDHYDHIAPLSGCVNDAYAMKAVLSRHSDGLLNFEVLQLVGAGQNQSVTRGQLRDAVEKLFTDGEPDIALFYFAGHGFIETTGGFLCCSDTAKGHDGLSLTEIVNFANKSRAKNKVIILDSCHSGVAGGSQNDGNIVEIKEGVTILTASSAEQYASEANGSGVFTTLLVDALNGSACNLVGDVTPGSVYAHIDQSLGAWEQRPMFKTNVRNFISLRRVNPPIALEDLQRLAEFFPTPGYVFPLDPSFEPKRNEGEEHLPLPDPDNTSRFAILQRMNRVNLVNPVGAEHMYYAAMESKSCQLTVLGEHYRSLVARGRL